MKTKTRDEAPNFGADPSRNTKKKAEDEDGPVTTCGLGSWRPPWLQVFASPLCFMINMAIIGVVQSATGALFFSAMSTFEKRYAFDSKISGLILIADNISEMLLNPIVGYIGVRYNRARLIAFGEVVVAISCFTTALPYFIYGPATHLLADKTLLGAISNRTNFEMCSAVAEPYDCSDGRGATVWPAVALLLLGSFTRGLGCTCYFVIGLPYLDDNLQKKQTPMYIAIMQSMRLIGPAFGYTLSAFFLQFYENPFYDPGFGPKDPRFIGAWWLGFLVIGALLLLFALPMFFFPAEFKGATVKSVETQRKFAQGGGSLGAIKRFVANPLVILVVLGNIFRFIGLGGFFMFKAKYVESQFRQSSSAASLITGSATVLPVAIGILLGGLVVAYFKPRVRNLFIFVFLVESVYIVSLSAGLFLGCDPINISGQYDSVGKFSPQSSCMKGCDCSTRVYTPICAPDARTTYFSPCHAGCTSYNSKSSTFEDCSCFSGVASKGYCPSDVSNCQNLVKYVSFITAGGIVSSMAKTANSLIAIRTVDPIDKGFTAGLAITLLDIFAFIPYPLIFGYIADTACLIWESKCGKTGNCWVYDHDKFRNRLHGAAIAFNILGSLFDFAIIFYAGRLSNFYGEEDKKGVEQTEMTPVSGEKTPSYAP